MSARIPRGGLGPLNSDQKLLLSSGALNNPYVDPALVSHLQLVFKPTLDKEYDLRAYDRQLGHQEVIEYLLKTVQAQEEEETSKYV